MKKVNMLLVLVVQASLLTACGGQQQLPMQPNMPGNSMGGGSGYSTTPGYNTGAGYGASDPYAQQPGYGASDPYAQQPGYGASDPYGTGGGYTQPGYGANDPYGTGGGYAQPGYGNGANTGYGQPGIDPVTGQPMMNNSAVSQAIVNKIQEAGGYRGSKADNLVVEALKAISIPQALGNAPLEHRALMIKSLLDGWAGDEDRNIAQQVWSTIMPQDQQQLLSQDAELSKLVNDKLLKNKSNGIGSIFSEVGKLVGLGK